MNIGGKMAERRSAELAHGNIVSRHCENKKGGPPLWVLVREEGGPHQSLRCSRE